MAVRHPRARYSPGNVLLAERNGNARLVELDLCLRDRAVPSISVASPDATHWYRKKIAELGSEEKATSAAANGHAKAFASAAMNQEWSYASRVRARAPSDASDSRSSLGRPVTFEILQRRSAHREDAYVSPLLLASRRRLEKTSMSSAIDAEAPLLAELTLDLGHPTETLATVGVLASGTGWSMRARSTIEAVCGRTVPPRCSRRAFRRCPRLRRPPRSGHEANKP